MAEYVFALLTEAVVESIGSENAARLAAMEAAHDNVEKKLGELHLTAREARQEEITAELLELIAGAEALTPLVSPPPGAPRVPRRPRMR
jgi:F-type H+-transporting ATPase subunit gamma